MQQAAVERLVLYFDWKTTVGVQQRLLQQKRSIVQLYLVPNRIFPQELTSYSVV